MRTYPKRLLTVVMVLAMLVSMMAVPGMAAETDNTLTVGNEGGLTLADALTQAASMTGDVTVEIYGQVDFTDGMELNSGSYTSISFVGKTDDAKMTIKQSGGGDYLEAHGKTVSFTDLILSKDPDAWASNSGHMGNYFSLQGGTATYNNCTFTHGACTSGGTATYNGCTFQNSSEYGLWVYDDALVTVNGGTIDSAKGIKIYAEDETSVTSTLTVQNATFTANVTKKPAVAIAYAASVTLLGNTYNNTSGILELDSGSDADCNGIPFVAQDASGNDISYTITPKDRSNGDAYCGALMDGKIYISATEAAKEKGTDSVIILLSDTNETLELDGISVDYRGWEASGITVKDPVAYGLNGVYASLSAAIEKNINAWYPIELLKDVTVSTQIDSTAPFTLEGNGHTITSTIKSPIRLFHDATINNVTIKNATYEGRCIDIRNPGLEVYLNSVNLVTTSTGNNQPVNVGGAGGDMVYLHIEDTTIDAGVAGYAITTWNPTELVIQNSTAVAGYAALYIREASNSLGSNGSEIYVINSDLVGNNCHSGESNSFATIALYDNGVNVLVDADSTVTANATGTAPQSAVGFYKGTIKDCNVTINGTVVTNGENAYVVGGLTNDNPNTVTFAHTDDLYKQLQDEGYDPTSNGTTITVYPKHDHEMTKHDAVPATCREDGNVEYYTCDICQKHFFKLEDGSYDECGVNDVITSTSTHLKPVEVPAKAPTCTEDGNIKYYHCDACDENYIISEIGLQIPADETMIVDPATGHKLTAVAAKAPTCTEDGVNAHYTCSGCDLLFNDPKGLSTITKQQATAKAAGHKAVMGVVGKLPTCTEPGNIEYVECSCGALFTDAECKNPITAAETVIPTVAHKLTKTPAVAATCTTAGNTEYYTCETCKALFADAEGKTGTTAEKVVITATGHALTKVAAVAATCTTAGNTEYYTCANCKALFADAEGKTATTAEKVTVAATGHKLTKVEAVAPTYTADGSAEHYACACGALFADAEGKTATTKEALILPQLIEIKESTAEVSTGAVDTAIKEAETTGSVTIDLVEVADEEAAKPEDGTETKPEPAPVVSSAALPVTSLEKVAEISEEATLTLNMTEVTVTMDAKTMAAVAEQSAGATVTLKVEKIETKALTEEQQAVIEDKAVAVVVSATLISNNVAISDFNGGEVTIALPFTLPEGTEGSDFQVYYVADDGTMTAHETEYKNGCLVFSTTHFSDYVVVNTAAPADPTVPNTGDNADLMLYTTALMIALTGLAALFISKKKFSF